MVTGQSATGVCEPLFDWAPERKANTAFMFYRMTDGAAWVTYTLQDGGFAIAAWPRAEKGWDEALPAPVGLPETKLGVYRIENRVGAITFLGQHSTTVLGSSDPRDFEGH